MTPATHSLAPSTGVHSGPTWLLCLADLRFGADDFEHLYFDDEWLGEERAKELELVSTAEACRGTQEEWQAAFDRYLSVLVAVCWTAMAELRTAGTVGSDFVAVLFDDERYEPLLRACLTDEELDRLFPELGVLAAERARVAALPVYERVAYYVSRLDGGPGIIDCEEAEHVLREEGDRLLVARRASDGLLGVLLGTLRARSGGGGKPLDSLLAVGRGAGHGCGFLVISIGTGVAADATCAPTPPPWRLRWSSGSSLSR